MQLSVTTTTNVLFDVGFLKHGVCCKEQHVVLHSGQEMVSKVTRSKLAVLISCIGLKLFNLKLRKNQF